MKPAATSFSLPDTIEPDLARILAYWKDLLRGEATMPFSDDVDLAHLGDAAGRAFLVLAFQDPQRFRFEATGADVAQQYGAALDGAFTDEIENRAPFDAFTEQCAAAVAQQAPTYYRSAAPGASYARLVLPTWADGHVSLLLGTVAEARG